MEITECKERIRKKALANRFLSSPCERRQTGESLQILEQDDPAQNEEIRAPLERAREALENVFSGLNSALSAAQRELNDRFHALHDGDGPNPKAIKETKEALKLQIRDLRGPFQQQSQKLLSAIGPQRALVSGMIEWIRRHSQERVKTFPVTATLVLRREGQDLLPADATIYAVEENDILTTSCRRWWLLSWIFFQVTKLRLRRRVRRLRLSQPLEAPDVQKTLRENYFENLFELTGGNMYASLFYWLLSLRHDRTTDTIVVSASYQIDYRFLRGLDAPYLFTLAELLNHGELTHEEHQIIFRTDAFSSQMILDYLCDLQLTQESCSSETNSLRTYSVSPLFLRPVTATLESMNILY